MNKKEMEYKIKELEMLIAERHSISSPTDVYKCSCDLIDNWNQEHFIVHAIDQQNKIISSKTIHIGGTGRAIVDPKNVFTFLLLQPRIAAMIVVHNHPSGQLKPSNEDIAITMKLKASAQMLDIAFLDHVILTQTDYYSFQTQGHI